MSEEIDNEDENYPYEEYNDEYINTINWSETFLDNLISNPNINKMRNNNEEENDSQILTEFKKNNINRLYEEIILYFSSPKILKKFKSGLIDEEKNYVFYKDLASENFMIEQKERIKRISKLPKLKQVSRITKRKLLDYKNIFFSTTFSDEYYKTKFDEANTLRAKMEKYSYLCLKENDDNKILSYLKKLKAEFSKALLDLDFLGLVHFNFIENNLVLLLTIIKNKFYKNKNKEKINKFIIECSNILKIFKSSKLFYFIIKYSKENIDILENLETKGDIVQFIPKTMIYFNTIKEAKDEINQKYDLRNILTNEEEKRNFRTIIYDNYLVIFFEMNKNIKNSQNIHYNYLKIHLKSQKIIYSGKIDVVECSDKIIDISTSLKNDIIYFGAIIENNKKFFLKYVLLNKYSSTLIRKGEIELSKENFDPFLLLNDNKYFYCISKSNNSMLIIKKNDKFDNLKYLQYNLALSGKKYNALFYSFKNYNSLYFNNLFIVNSTNDGKKYFLKLIKNKDNSYFINYFQIDKDEIKSDDFPMISYNDNQCIITYLDYKSKKLYISICLQKNHFFNCSGITFLPFQSYQYNNYSNNIYEHLLQEYSSYMNIFGNFDLLLSDDEYILRDNIFSLCCNFDENNLDFIIKNIIENDNCNNIKLYYIIILKQLICSLYNIKNFKEKKIKEIIPFFKKLILNNMKAKDNKIFNIILKEIIIIASYMSNNIIEINDINIMFDGNDKSIQNKTKFLLIELLLQQNKTQKQKELFENIIKFEKNFLINIIKNESLEDQKDIHYSSYYNSLKPIMIEASEILFKLNDIFKDDIISFIPLLSDSIIEICEQYHILLDKNSNKENNYIEYSFLYYSFIFRTFFFIIEKLICNKIFLKEKENILSIYRVILILDKLSKNYFTNEYIDMNNIIEIKYNPSKNKEIYWFSYTYDIDVNGSDIIFYTNFISNKKYNNYISLNIEDNFGFKHFIIKKGNIFLYQKVKHINVIFDNSSTELTDNFIIKIIPLKDKYKYNSYSKNENNEIISLIQKTIIHYFLYLFEDIHSQIDNFNNDKNKKNKSKIYQTELFKFISIPEKEYIIQDDKDNSSNINIIINKLNKILNNEDNNFNRLNNDLADLFNFINKNMNSNESLLFKNYSKNIQKINENAF